MTNRTEALEQIWLEDLEEETKGFIGYAWGSPIKGLLEPYIRADLSDAKDARIAELEAELYAMTEDRNIISETSQQQFIHTVQLKAKLAKAVKLMELSVELATWNTTLLDDVIFFITELKETD